MQRSVSSTILFFITVFFILSSCSKKTNKEGRYVPETANLVFLMNGESLSSKVSWEEMKNNAVFSDIDSSVKMEDFQKAAFENPEVTGIDIKKDLLVFFEKDSLGGYLAFEGTIKDAAKFKDFSTRASKGGKETEKNGIHFISNSKMTTTWDKEKFILVIDAPQMKNRRARFGDDNDLSIRRDLISTANAIYGLAEKQSLGSNERFSELVSKKGDVHFWFNVSSFASENEGMAAMSMLNVSKLYEDYRLTGIANFDNGKINVDLKTYAGKQLSDLYKKYSGVKINTEMVKRIPAQDLAALVAISFKPEAVKEFAKLAGLDGFINMGTAQLGFTLDDCIKALKGDMVLGISGLTKDSSGKTDMNAIFSASIDDKNSFSKIYESLNNLKKQKMAGAAAQFSMATKDNLFAAGNDKATIDKYLATSNNSNYSFLDKVSGSASVFYINFQNILSSFGKDVKDSLDNIVYQNAVRTLDNVIATGEGFKDGGSNTHIELNFMDKSTNSLKQLYSFIGVVANIQKQKRSQTDRWMEDKLRNPDSTTTAVPMPQQ